MNNIEEKLASIKGFYEKFYELIAVVSQTHGTIFQELKAMKLLLNQTQIKETIEKNPSVNEIFIFLPIVFVFFLQKTFAQFI